MKGDVTLDLTTTLQGIFEARNLLKQYMARTPLHHYPALSKLLEAEVYVKHENHTAIGSFKIRGGINAIARLSEEQRRQGVILSSSGNFGQAVAYAGRLFGVRTMIGMPRNPNPGKAEAIENFGGELLIRGDGFEENLEYVETMAAENGYYHLNDAEDPHFVAGLGTCMLEILEDLPDVDVVIAPVGGGGLVSGLCIAGKGIKPDVQIIGVCAEAAPSAYLSWKEGRLVEAPMGTFAEGIAVRTSFEAPQQVMRELLDDFVLVSEDEIRRAIVLMLEKAHSLVEGAGATPLAAAMKLMERIRGKKLVLVQSGGNISLQRLREALAAVQGAQG